VTDETAFAARLSAILRRIAPGELHALNRLSGGANMESWSIDWGPAGAPIGYILRRAPSAEWMEGRPFGLEDEAALVRAAHAGGVLAPQIVAELTPADDLGQGYIMLRVEAEVSPVVILAQAAPTLIDDIAREMARVHALPMESIPAAIPLMDTGSALADLKSRFISYGSPSAGWKCICLRRWRRLWSMGISGWAISWRRPLASPPCSIGSWRTGGTGMRISPLAA
jgi:aminoglycoside phosphotransferase (APT) family kinase protein